MQELYLKYKEMLDQGMENFLDNEFKGMQLPLQSISQLIEHIKNFCLDGGKRIRGVLILLGYQCFKKELAKEAMDAAIAFELVHSCLLVHDDIMDGSDLRRGSKSFHKIYEHSVGDMCNEAKKFGEGVAMTVGDILLALSYNSISNCLNKIAGVYTRIIVNTAYGQILDLESGFKELSEKDVLNMYMLKSAKYTIEGPLHLGATLAGATEDSIKKLSQYAIPLGVAFQLKDDILGLFGEEKKIGKPVTSDLSEGKKTVLVLKALENASNHDKEYLLSVLGNTNITLEDVEKVREIVKKTGSLEYSANMINKLINDSKAVLTDFDINSEAKKALLYLADYVGKRDL